MLHFRLFFLFQVLRVVIQDYLRQTKSQEVMNAFYSYFFIFTKFASKLLHGSK
jgi:hypothetical protein